MRATALLSAGLAVALVLTGCGDDDDTTDGAAATDEEGAQATTSSTGPSSTGPSSTGPSSTGTPGTDPPATDPTTTSTTTTSPPPDERVVELTFSGGEVTGGPQKVALPAGERVQLLVTSDVPEEVHVHGYDLEVPLAPGTPTPIDLVGDLPGVWEVELHGSGDLLCELEVGA